MKRASLMAAWMMLGLTGMTVLPATAGVEGYVVDGNGKPIRSGFGECVRSGSWSAERPGESCDAGPDRVVLLPGPDGKVGAVVVRGASGEKLLDKAYAGAEIVTGGAIVLRQETATIVQSRYGVLLGAQPPRPQSFTVYFLSGSATELTAESKPLIEAMKATLASRPAPEITVIGHTDRAGKAEANDALSIKRAEVVRDILLASGVRSLSLDVAGRGEREPVVPTADEVAEARNRRVEISIR